MAWLSLANVANVMRGNIYGHGHKSWKHICTAHWWYAFTYKLHILTPSNMSSKYKCTFLYKQGKLSRYTHNYCDIMFFQSQDLLRLFLYFENEWHVTYLKLIDMTNSLLTFSLRCYGIRSLWFALNYGSNIKAALCDVWKWSLINNRIRIWMRAAIYMFKGFRFIY